MDDSPINPFKTIPSSLPGNAYGYHCTATLFGGKGQNYPILILNIRTRPLTHLERFLRVCPEMPTVKLHRDFVRGWRLNFHHPNFEYLSRSLGAGLDSKFRRAVRERTQITWRRLIKILRLFKRRRGLLRFLSRSQIFSGKEA